ncbi:MAG: hypothetical protein ABI361_07600 [Nitrososphaera sp.]
MDSETAPSFKFRNYVRNIDPVLKSKVQCAICKSIFESLKELKQHRFDAHSY